MNIDVLTLYIVVFFKLNYYWHLSYKTFACKKVRYLLKWWDGKHLFQPVPLHVKVSRGSVSVDWWVHDMQCMSLAWLLIYDISACFCNLRTCACWSWNVWSFQVLGFGEYIEEVYSAYEQHKLETMVIVYISTVVVTWIEVFDTVTIFILIN